MYNVTHVQLRWPVYMPTCVWGCMAQLHEDNWHIQTPWAETLRRGPDG
jgi:hypothetical protein